MIDVVHINARFVSFRVPDLLRRLASSHEESSSEKLIWHNSARCTKLNSTSLKALIVICFHYVQFLPNIFSFNLESSLYNYSTTSGVWTVSYNKKRLFGFPVCQEEELNEFVRDQMQDGLIVRRISVVEDYSESSAHFFTVPDPQVFI